MRNSPCLDDQAAWALYDVVANEEVRWTALLAWAGADPFRWPVLFRIGSPAQPTVDWETTRRAMGAARRLSERLNLARMKPLPELASSGLCLAEPGQAFVVFHRGNKPLTIRAGAGWFIGAWLDPVSGEEASQILESVSQESLTLHPPKPNDHRLWIHRAGQ